MAKIEIDGKIMSCADEAVEWFIQYKGAKLAEEPKKEVKAEAPKKKTRRASKK